MCGHGTIGTVTVAIEQNLIRPQTPGVLNLEVPAGLVRAEYVQEGNKVTSVKITNVKSYLAAEALTVECPDLGTLTVDVAANWWNAEDDSNLTRMLKKEMLKKADGSLMTKDDFRIILKSELIINSPTAYLADLPDDAKKAGMTGYDFGSKADDVKDGLSNTMYLIQVPPTYQRPWIAGGGATLTGVNDKGADPARPFMVKKGDGTRGTMVLMGDGSVRYVKEGIDPAVFRGMATRAGGETLTDLDKAAPPARPNMPGELKSLK